MRKLLLFALTVGISTMTFAQFNGNASVDSYALPTGTIILEDPANGTTSIKVNITNNTADTIPDLTNFFFYVTLDGTKVKHPVTGTDEWGYSLINPLPNGSTIDALLTAELGATGDRGSRPLCVELYQYVMVKGTAPGLYTNVDGNKELCENFDFGWPVGVSDVTSTEISKIITNGDLMKVYINGNTSSQIKMMNITGQVVKTINTSITGNNTVENVDISDLTPGVYIVTIQSENGSASAKKVFIQ